MDERMNSPLIGSEETIYRSTAVTCRGWGAMTFLRPYELLLTQNRKDIEYRIDFLNDVIDDGVRWEKTLYYQFIGDSRRGIDVDSEEMSREFVDLYRDIDVNGIKTPLRVGKHSKEWVDTQYYKNGRQVWTETKNETGYQLIEGAHRLAIALKLGYETVPAKVHYPLFFEVPNYTEYINQYESEYQESVDR